MCCVVDSGIIDMPFEYRVDISWSYGVTSIFPLLEYAMVQAKPESTVVGRVSCENCSAKISVTVGDVADQDHVGNDYEDGSQGGGVQCPDESCGWRAYLTSLCAGKPDVDCGKFHNHCTECKGYGVCVGDYRTAHCEGCGKHYFCGLSGFGCPKCDDADDNDPFGLW